MDTTTASLITTFDYVWDRLTSRLNGLTDEEYFWEPVAGCWSLRQNNQGRWQLDGGGGGGPAPDPAPVTTIAWRLGHLGGLAVGGFADRRFSAGTLTVAQIDFPPSAAAVPGFLDEHYQNWRAGLAGLSPGEWASPLGLAWGGYAESNTVDLALHVLDEVIHHGAEVGLLRDLYSHRSSLRAEPARRSTRPLLMRIFVSVRTLLGIVRGRFACPIASRFALLAVISQMSLALKV